ncbi:MAG TPA: hypothetical protein VE974_01245 [Thermoanaerobaculia bacterium]|nr:hypothetical protein [Thermoanaerobaculia bacterium]
MDETTRSNIRHIFLSPRPSFALLTAADLLGMTLKERKREVKDGSIVAVSTGLGQRITREEMIAAAMRLWEQSVIEEALGDDAASVLPEAIRLVELRARVPRYQREMLRYLAKRHGTTVDEVLTRELEDVACAHSQELAAAVPGFELALAWPENEVPASGTSSVQ